MILSEALLKLKAKADELWIQGEEFESQDFEPEEIDACFDRAFEIYQQVYELLKQVDVQQALKDPLPPEEQFEIIQLYYVYKILATAHFDMGEYELAAELYQNALDIHQRYQPLFKKDVKENELNAIRYNFALARLYALQEEDTKEQQDESANEFKNAITQVATVFISELSKCRESKTTGFKQTRVIEHLLECKTLLTQKPVLFSDEKHKQHLHWAFRYVLTNEQILNYVTANIVTVTFQDFISAISPALSEEQLSKIKAFTPPQKKVEGNISRMLNHLEKFKKSPEYQKLQLHPYQDEAISKFEEHLTKGNNVGFYVAATGTGKTRIFIGKMLATDSNAIVLVPSIALAQQTKEKLQEQLDELGIKKKVGVFADGEKSKGDIVIMTYNSLKAQQRKPPKKRELNLDRYPMVIFDEAHLALTEKANEIIQELAQDKVVIGCTATDEYNTKRPKGALKSLKELFGEANGYFSYPIHKAIEEGSLSPVHICMVTTDTSLRWKRGVKKKKSGQNEISEKEAAEQINKDKINTVVAEIYANSVHPNTGERLFGKQAVAFCAGIDHAKAVADKFNELFKENDYIKRNNLIPAAYISGEMSGEEQNKILEDYRAGKILLLCGSDILVTGIDNPNICAAFNLRPTRSVVMALQRGGRTVRKSKDIPNKVALIFEFNWVVDGQVFLHDFLEAKHQLGKIPEVSAEFEQLQTLRREEVGLKFDNGARWEIDWTGKVRAHSVGVARRTFDLKVPEMAPPQGFPVVKTESSMAVPSSAVVKEEHFEPLLSGSLSKTSIIERPEPLAYAFELEATTAPLTYQYDALRSAFPPPPPELDDPAWMELFGNDPLLDDNPVFDDNPWEGLEFSEANPFSLKSSF